MPISTEHAPHRENTLHHPLAELEKLFAKQQDKIEPWFEQQWRASPPPFYGSVDLRHAGFKIAPVDTNLFPAGFNNLGSDTMPLCIQAAQATIAEISPHVTRLLIIPENHSRNTFYFESLATLQSILQQAGFEVRIGSLDRSLTEPTTHRLTAGRTLLIEPLVRENSQVGVTGFSPCSIILNNDLSDGVPEMLTGLQQRIMPATALGWATRLKSDHFQFYQHVVDAFSDVFDLDPWLLSPLFDRCPDVDFMKREGQACLVKRSEGLLKAIQKKYDAYGIKQEPFLVVKADAGTYGMAVMMIRDPEELYELNRKQRTRMSSTKGGSNVTKAIIQEGIHTMETMPEDQAVAEPVIYMMGRHALGGFYRAHKSRGATDNLNAPGMDFRPFKLKQKHATSNAVTQSGNCFYTYSVVSRLALLAASRELAASTGDAA